MYENAYSLVWKRFDELVDQMTDEDKAKTRHHRFHDDLLKMEYLRRGKAGDRLSDAQQTL